MATPLMFEALNKSAQAPALVELLLKGKADVNAIGHVSAREGNGAGCHMRGVAGRWIIVGCSPVKLGGRSKCDG